MFESHKQVSDNQTFCVPRKKRQEQDKEKDEKDEGWFFSV
jgi:hypothetical protein